MTLKPDEKRALSDIRMEKALEFQLDAEETAARSLLILEGMNPETHDGIITMLSLHFIKKEFLPVTLIKSYKMLLSRRTDVDYGDFDAVDKETAESSIAMSAEAISMIQNMRQKLLTQ